MHACRYKIDADNQQHNCICGLLSMDIVKNIRLHNHCGAECLSKTSLILYHDVEMTYEDEI